MQPKSKNEKRVWELYDRLPGLNIDTEQFAIEHIGGKQKAYFNKKKLAVLGTYKCTVCGHEWSNQYDKEVACPHCGQLLETEVTKKKKYNNKQGQLIAVGREEDAPGEP